MSYYQEGYDKGYEDGSTGENSLRNHYPLSDVLDALLNTEEQTEWEEGYDKDTRMVRKNLTLVKMIRKTSSCFSIKSILF